MDRLDDDLEGLGIRRVVTVGGVTKEELLERLHANSVALNEYAEMLFACDGFTTAKVSYDVRTLELAVEELEFPSGASLAAILARAQAMGLDYCPLELGPRLRLVYIDQPESTVDEPKPHQAPPGSITVVSQPISDDEDFPRGFYLRRADGVLWLRGYCSPGDHIFAPEDHLLFRVVAPPE